jgi:hypothetical protein
MDTVQSNNFITSSGLLSLNLYRMSMLWATLISISSIITYYVNSLFFKSRKMPESLINMPALDQRSVHGVSLLLTQTDVYANQMMSGKYILLE